MLMQTCNVNNHIKPGQAVSWGIEGLFANISLIPWLLPIMTPKGEILVDGLVFIMNEEDQIQCKNRSFDYYSDAINFLTYESKSNKILPK